MPQNKLSDLNNHLFLQLERLNSDELKGDKLKEEVNRARAMAAIATQIVLGAKTTVDAIKLAKRGDIGDSEMKLITGK